MPPTVYLTFRRFNTIYFIDLAVYVYFCENSHFTFSDCLETFNNFKQCDCQADG